jgi:hypothetical protein
MMRTTKALKVASAASTAAVRVGDRKFELRPMLRELIGLVAQEIRILRQALERLYDDWFADTGQDWIVPWIGDRFPPSAARRLALPLCLVLAAVLCLRRRRRTYRRPGRELDSGAGVRASVGERAPQNPQSGPS